MNKSTGTSTQVTLQRTVEGTWRGGLRCDVAAGNFTVVVDEPASVGGTDCGPQPTDLLLASVASCFTLAVAYCAQKRAITLDSLSVKVTGIYDGPRFRSIAIDSRVGCASADVAMLVHAAKRVCYVTNTLQSEVNITVEASAA
ncbi:OsmC family protein [Paraburkholderia hospita]